MYMFLDSDVVKIIVLRLLVPMDRAVKNVKNPSLVVVWMDLHLLPVKTTLVVQKVQFYC